MSAPYMEFSSVNMRVYNVVGLFIERSLATGFSGGVDYSFLFSTIAYDNERFLTESLSGSVYGVYLPRV